MSPAYSAPHIWDREYSNMLLNSDGSEMATGDMNELDGFTVSSSARPFHGSQFNAQCHTWPTTDMDFSWSQVQVI